MKLDKLMPLAAAAAILGKRRGGKRTHVSTLHRWSRRGLRGVRLETIRIGGVVCTSEAALEAFFQALSARDAGPASPLQETSGEQLVDAGLRAKGLIESSTTRTTGDRQ
jgi:hypothetical protein